MVSSEPMDLPLIGCSVTEQLILGLNENAHLVPTIVNLLRGAMNLQEDKATALVNFIQSKLSRGDKIGQLIRVF